MREEETVMLQIKHEDDNTLNDYGHDEFDRALESLQQEIDSQTNISEELEINVDEDGEEYQGLLSESPSVEPKPKKERQYWIDALRVLSSYMVVLVHSSSYAIFDVPLFTWNWYGLMFWDAMSRICVPLFIMISGVLFLNPEKDIPIGKLYKKYIYRIIKVTIFWNAIYATIVKYQINAFGIEYHWSTDIISDFFVDVVYGKFHMWYLYMCIGLYMVTPLMRAITKDKVAMKYFVLMGILLNQAIPFVITLINYFYSKDDTVIFSDLITKMMIFTFYGYTCHYVVGYYLSTVEIKNKFLLFLIYGIGLVTLFFTYIVKVILSVLNQKEITEFGDYNSLNVSMTAIIAFIFFKHTGKHLLDKLFLIKGVKVTLLKLSELSFGIYLVHIFYFELFRRLNFNSYTFNSFIFSPIHALIIWICSAITVFILKFIPYVKDYV